MFSYLLFLLFFMSCLFFFFKQKTAYEMRISDWSSDVCSSDLAVIRPPITAVAIGERKLESVPLRLSAIGSMPAIIATVVITIGRARLWQASRIASVRDRPR